MKSWKPYYENRAEKGPRTLMLEALRYVEQYGKALDLGAGGLADTQHLLSRFDHVTAVDSDQDSLDRSERVVADNLVFVPSGFEDFAYGEDTFDFINAQFSLPFIDPTKFDHIVDKIMGSLKNGGVFAGTLFGVDDWRNDLSKVKRQLVFITEAEARALFKDVEILEFNVDEAEATKGHKQVYKIIVRK
jgi:tellurite methyltransferase